MPAPPKTSQALSHEEHETGGRNRSACRRPGRRMQIAETPMTHLASGWRSPWSTTRRSRLITTCSGATRAFEPSQRHSGSRRRRSTRSGCVRCDLSLRPEGLTPRMWLTGA